MRTTTQASQQYLAAVEQELSDLPAEERSELLEDLASHLASVEEEDGDSPLEARLGSAASYASELRSAAGLPPRHVPDAPRRLRLAVTAVRGSALLRELLSFGLQLRPAWWVLRGYLVVLLPSLRHVTGSRDFPVPAPLGSHLAGGALVAAAVVLSVLLGRRRLPRAAVPLVIIANLVLAVAAVNVASDAPDRLRVRVRVEAHRVDPFVLSPLITVHGPVTNVYPFSADGTPLTGVLLYDQDGRPLRTGTQLWWADRCRRVVEPPRAADGVPVPFSYPKAYVLDPSAVTLSGVPVAAGQCHARVAPPAVTLPVLPKRAP